MKIKTLSEVLLCALLVRILVLGASLGDSFALIGLATLYGYQQYLAHNKIKTLAIDFEERLKVLEGGAVLNRLAVLESKAADSESKFGALSLMGRR